MKKKVLTLLLLGALAMPSGADDATSSEFMLTNNYNVRNSSDIWQRMRQGFRINFPHTAKVRYYEKMYSRNQATFDRVMRNSSLYLYYVLAAVERYGLPSELALIPIVESNYDTLAVNSTGRYDGIWQFTPATGGDFGLNETSSINDRQNIAKATDAAMLYLNYLNLVFKQWDVAIGAYNWGPGSMYKAVVNSGQKIGAVDYNQLELREITANYVPKIIALANIIKNPQHFGIKLANVPNEPVFALTKPTPGVSVASLIKTAEMDSKDFKTLNAHYKTTSYVLNNQSIAVLPIASQQTYLAANPNYRSNQVIQLARNNNSNVDALHISNVNNVATNTPNDAINQVAYDKALSTSNEIKTADNVKFKDATDDEISQLNNSSEAKLSATNSDDEKVPTLIVPKYANQPMPKPTLADAQVPNGSHAQLVNELIDNTSSSNTARKPMRLAKSNAKATTARKTTTIKHYKVHKGDTLYSIAKKFDIALADLKQANRIKSNHVKTGQLLVIR